jgi:DnaJ-class molecular chaperone
LAANPETGYRASSPNGAGPDPDQEDHYALIGVPYSATHAEITRAYRRAMKLAHPDRQRPERRAAAEDLARRLNAAYAVLSDPVKRQAYDRTIQQQVIQDQIMRQYVGGFHTFDGQSPSGPARPEFRREPTAAERRERVRADRQASMTLVFVAVALTVLIVVLVLFGSVLGSVFDVVR